MRKIGIRAACILGLLMIVFGIMLSGLRQPGMIVHAQSGHNILVTWTAPATDATHDPATGYNVLRGTASGAEAQYAVVNAPTVQFTDTAGVGGTTYFYEIVAFNSGGSAGPSNETNATFLANPPNKAASAVATPR